MIKSDKVYLEHILEAISKIESYTLDTSASDFAQNVAVRLSACPQSRIATYCTVHPLSLPCN
jgi:uncharacterized protein with HEPN domain